MSRLSGRRRLHRRWWPNLCTYLLCARGCGALVGASTSTGSDQEQVLNTCWLPRATVEVAAPCLVTQVDAFAHVRVHVPTVLNVSGAMRSCAACVTKGVAKEEGWPGELRVRTGWRRIRSSELPRLGGAALPGARRGERSEGGREAGGPFDPTRSPRSRAPPGRGPGPSCDPRSWRGCEPSRGPLPLVAGAFVEANGAPVARTARHACGRQSLCSISRHVVP